MLTKPALTPEFCLHAVVKSTPFPSRFQPPKSKPSTMTLFDLGVVDSQASGVFVEGVKAKIRPWNIDDANVASSSDTTLQDAADSVEQNAF
jgi:hypothetical protein